MIGSRRDYLDYLEADRIALSRSRSFKALLTDEIWKFQRLMRRLEYLTNCRKNRILRLVTAYRYRKQAMKLGYSIPINTFGPGLSIAHVGTLVVSKDARIGANCRIHVCVNIGTAAGKPACAPTLGDNCYIAPGAKLFGDIKIGPRTAIGANAVVNKSFPEGNATIGGIPAKIISDKNSDGLLIEGYPVTS